MAVNFAGVNQILDIAPFACVLIANDYCIKYINPDMSEFLCLSPKDELIGSSFLKYLPEKEHKSFKSFVENLIKPLKEQSWQVYTIIDSKGNNKEILFNGTNNLSEHGDNADIILIGLPLLNQNLEKILPKIVEKKLLEKFSYNKYQTLFDSATIGILVLKEDGIIDETNQSFADYFNLTKEEIHNKHLSEIFKETAKEDFDKLRRMVNAAKKREVKNIITIEPEDGEHIILEISLAKINEQYGNEQLIMMIAEDITDEQDTHTALIQSEKLALTGRLAASLAHEINNPLQTSIGCLGLADEMLNSDDRDLSVYINMAMEELQRSARIVKKLRDLNRSTGDEDKEPIDLQDLLDGVLLLTKNRLYDRNIVPVYPYQGPPPIVIASKDQIQQVLLNLMMNAIDALPKGGNIYLDIQLTETPKGVSVTIRDTGVGMSREVIQNLFDPFFTTKEEGLGLGLYICKKIIDDHNGKLSVESEPGKGTEFSIWLPGLDVDEQDEE